MLSLVALVRHKGGQELLFYGIYLYFSASNFI